MLQIQTCVCAGIFLIIFSLAPQVKSETELWKNHHKYNLEVAARLEQWNRLMLTAKYLPEQEKLIQVNDFFNHLLKFSNDSHLWNIQDYWADPMELLIKGAGDCEDYSIAKYLTLKQLKVSDEKLRLTYVTALNLNQAHMVLSYFSNPAAEPVVLDNLIAEIKPRIERTDLLPLFSFNASSLWLVNSNGNGKKIGKSMHLNMWAKLTERMQNFNGITHSDSPYKSSNSQFK